MDPSKAMSSVPHGAPPGFQVASRIDQSEHVTPQIASPVLMITGSSEKKKRGRPRKYKSNEPSNSAFSSFQASSSAQPAVSKAYGEENSRIVTHPISSEKRYKGKIGTEKLDDWIECSTGSSFLPHVINVNTGEDITSKIMEFAQQGPRAVCIISGSGTVSNVTVRHPNSSGGILTYEGIFEILSFSGSFTPTEMQDLKNRRSGTMTITLSGADGRVVGGLVAGLTIAATPIKVVVASFLMNGPQELKPKQQQMFKVDDASGPIGSSAPKAEKQSPNSVPFAEGLSTGSKSQNNLASWSPVAQQSVEKTRKPDADINISLHG